MVDEWEVIKAAGNEDIQLNFKGYANKSEYSDDSYFSGNSDNGIALANWNHIDESVAENLSRMGVCLESNNDFNVCCECGKVIRMLRPNSIELEESWFKDAAEVGCNDEKDVFCGSCIVSDDQCLNMLVDEVLSDSGRCITVENIDFSKIGFKKVLSNLKRGMDEGHDADPKRVSISLQSMGVKRFLFVMEHASSVAISFGVYVDIDEIGLINDPSDIMTSGKSLQSQIDEIMDKVRPDAVTADDDDGSGGLHFAAHAALGHENEEPIMMTHEEACCVTTMPDMGMDYLKEIKRIVNAENENSGEDSDEIWNSYQFRKVVFKNVGSNREGEIDRLRRDSKEDFYSLNNIRKFYRRILPSLLQ